MADRDLYGGPSYPIDTPAFNARENFITSQGVDQTIQGKIRDHQKKQQRWEDLGQDNPYPTINTNRNPTNPNLYNQGWMEAGITNPNLNGYKVWNAGGIQDKIDSWLGPLIEKNVDLENWEPTPWDFGIGNWIKNKINPGAQNELLKKELEELYIKQDEARMHPYFPAPGPWNEFYPGDVEHINDFLFEDEGIEPYEWDESAGTELAQSQWRRPENVEKTIDVLEIRPEFEGWSRDEIKAYIFRSTRQANRGGIIGLL